MHEIGRNRTPLRHERILEMRFAKGGVDAKGLLKRSAYRAVTIGGDPDAFE